jgi:galactose mutarotase-like enzyme
MERIFLDGGTLAATVIPACGGKIEPIESVRTGRRWLWRNPHLDLRLPEYGESYVGRLDFGGWDEIFPSVGPCEPSGMAPIPDHGDLVNQPWQVERHTPTTLRMSVEGRCAPFRFTRKITATGTGFLFEYDLENHGKQAFPWLWCAHPLINIEAGMQIDWGCGELTIPDPSAAGFSPWTRKFFTDRGTTDRVEIRAPGEHSESLVLQFDPDDAPYLGFWVNFLGWSGCGSSPYFNLGVEPATAPFDLLTDAIDAGAQKTLQPGERRSWKVEIRS